MRRNLRDPQQGASSELRPEAALVRNRGARPERAPHPPAPGPGHPGARARQAGGQVASLRRLRAGRGQCGRGGSAVKPLGRSRFLLLHHLPHTVPAQPVFCCQGHKMETLLQQIYFCPTHFEYQTSIGLKTFSKDLIW